MSIPDQPIFSAYLEVIQQATIYARHLALCKQSYEQISDLMDAIHVIPELLDEWERCDPPSLFRYLEVYDKKWSRQDNFSLVKIFEEYVQSKDQTKIINERRKNSKDKREQ